jgi:hypothetical protein
MIYWLFRFSAWTSSLTSVLIGVCALRSKNIWKNKFVFLGIDFCFIALMDLTSSLSDLFSFSNVWISMIYVPIDFTLIMLYLKGQHKSLNIKRTINVLIFIFIFFQIFQSINLEKNRYYDVAGMYINMAIILIYSLWNLTLLFQQNNRSGRLRINPDFWFTATTFCLCFSDAIITLLSYVSLKDNIQVFYAIYILRNLIHAVLFLGYYKGIKLLN